MNIKNKAIIIFTFVSILSTVSCETHKPTDSQNIDNNVAPALEKTTNFERDTMRKDAMKVVKEIKK